MKILVKSKCLIILFGGAADRKYLLGIDGKRIKDCQMRRESGMAIGTPMNLACAFGQFCCNPSIARLYLIFGSFYFLTFWQAMYEWQPI